METKYICLYKNYCQSVQYYYMVQRLSLKRENINLRYLKIKSIRKSLSYFSIWLRRNSLQYSLSGNNAIGYSLFAIYIYNMLLYNARVAPIRCNLKNVVTVSGRNVRHQESRRCSAQYTRFQNDA